jgi:transposase
MPLHLLESARRLASEGHSVVILDGAGYHGAGDLPVPENITLVPLPPYAPELNPIENVWEYLRGNRLAVTVFDSYDDIVEKASDAWRSFATDKERVASITARSWATVNI